MYYINTRYRSGPTETADQFPTRREAQKMLPEYRQCFPEHFCWVSTRCTNEWREEGGGE